MPAPRSLALLAAGLFGTAAIDLWTDRAPRRDETVEPPILLTFELGDTEREIEIGEPFTIPASGSPREALVRSRGYRVFPYAGVELRYPEHMAFEADIEDPPPQWTLDGNDATLIVQMHDDIDVPAFLVEIIADSMEEQFGSRAVKEREDARIELRGERVDGERVVLEFGDVVVIQEIFGVEHPDGGVVVLMLQDALDDDEEGHSDEYDEMREMLVDTFRFDSDER